MVTRRGNSGWWYNNAMKIKQVTESYALKPVLAR